MEILSLESSCYRVFRDRPTPRQVGYPTEGEDVLESDIDHAISNFEFCWSDTPKDLSRFSDGSWNVLYTAEKCETAVTEVVYHLDKNFGSGYASGDEMIFRLVQYGVIFNGTCACFANSDPETQSPLVANDNEYRYTIGVADDLRSSAQAIRTPSARRINELCIPILDEEAAAIRDVAIPVTVTMVRGSTTFKSLRESRTMDLEIHDVHSHIVPKP